MIAAANATNPLPQGPPGPPGRDGIPGRNGSDGVSAFPVNTTWKAEDIGLFAPDTTQDRHIRSVRGTTYCSNVYVFLNQLRSQIPLRGEAVVRANTQSCLRGEAYEWYNSELTDLERTGLWTYPVEHEFGWFPTLERRWKTPSTEAIKQLMDGYYTWSDVQNGRSATSWAQGMLRLARAADITDPVQQLRMVWTRMEPYLQRDIDEPGAGTTVASFIAQLEKRYPQWQNMSARSKELRQTRARERDRNRRDDRNDRNRRDDRGDRRTKERDQREDRNDRRERSNGRYERRDRPVQSNLDRKAGDRPGDRRRTDRRDDRNQDRNRNTAYLGNPPDDPEEFMSYSNEDNDHPNVYEDDPDDPGDFDDPEADFRRAASASTALAVGTAHKSSNAVTCWHCAANFTSRNKLHGHLKEAEHNDQQESSPQAAVGEDSGTEDDDYKPVIESNREKNATTPGQAYRTWRYLSTVAGLGTQNNKTKICLDSGCLMTLIDSELAKTLQLELHDTANIPVAGIGSKHASRAYINLPIFFHGEHNVAKITVEAHLVDNLATQLLLGMDAMGHEGFRMDLEARTVRIASCMGFTFPVDIHTKPHHQERRTVRAATTTAIPPRSYMKVDITTPTLPTDRHYLFTGHHTYASFYSHVVDADMSWVQAVNDTDKTVYVQRGTPVGHLTEMDQHTTAYAVSPHAAELGRSPTAKSLTYDGLKHAQHENVLPNGVTIFGERSCAKALSDVVNAYDVWASEGNTGLVKIPQDRWMEIPLVDGWEKLMPKPRVYPLGPADRKLVDDTFDKLHKEGKMGWSTKHTPIGFPVFVVHHDVTGPDGTTIHKTRPVVDIRGLNKISQLDVYPMRTQEEIIQMCEGAKFITVLDAKGFFYQWLVKPGHRERLAVISHRGQEYFKVAIMGYCNSVAYVQRQIDLILKDFFKWCRTYLDDIVVRSNSLQEHIYHLRRLFQRLQQYGIRLEPKKAYIGFPEVALLGQRVDALGLSTPKEKLKAIADLQFPETLKKLETYIGMTGDLRHIIPNYAQKVEPLQKRKTALLQGSPVAGQPRQQWARKTRLTNPTAVEREAFNALQKGFREESISLVHWAADRQTYIDIDASQQTGFGVVIYHVKGSYDHKDVTKPPPTAMTEPIMFLSRLLTTAEKNYWATELEVSCITWTIRKVRHHIEASKIPVIFYTDHSATIAIATSLRTVATEKLNLRLVRAAMYIQMFQVKVFHRPGRTNRIADALSRLPSATPSPAKREDDLDALWTTPTDNDTPYAFQASTMHMSDEFRQKIMDGYDTDPRWSRVRRQLREEGSDPMTPTLPYLIEDGFLYSVQDDGSHWLCIPTALAKDIFQLVHDEQGHQGFDRCRRKMDGMVIHKGMKLLKQYIDHCPECLRNNTRRHRPYGSLQPIVGPPIPFHTVCIDFVVGLPISRDGYNAIAFITCKFTKRIGAIPGKNTWKSKDWALAVLAHLQNADWGLPTVWISDRDPKFVKGFWKSMFNALRVALFFTAAYHAQADGQSERTNQTAEIWLRHWTSLHPTEDWPVSLPSLTAAMNGAVSASTSETPHKLMFGIDLRMPWNLLYNAFAHQQDLAPRQDAAECLKYAAMQMKDYYDRRHQPKHFDVGDKVLLRIGRGYNIPVNDAISRKLGQQYAGLFTVVERVGRLAYRLQLPPTWRIHPVISVQHLEPAPSPDPFNRELPQDPEPTYDDRFPDDMDRHDVAAVLDMRVRHPGRYRTPVKEYLIQWEGEPREQSQWVKERDAVGAEEKIREFEERRRAITGDE